MKLLVNADDYGIDENRTKAILGCFRIRAISHTTAMVNMPFYGRAVEMIKEEGLLDRMGLHLNLTEGFPLSDEIKSFPFFCNKDGSFNKVFHMRTLSRLRLSAAATEALRIELRAQIERFLKSGATRRHVDSHHHVHTDWSVMRVLMPLLKEYDFTSIRKSRNLGRGMSFPKRVYKKIFNCYLTSEFKSTDWFGGFDVFQYGCADLSEQDSVEVMVHPMFGTPENLNLSSELTDSGSSVTDELDFYQQKGVEFYD